MTKYRKIKKKRSIVKNKYFWIALSSLIIILGICYLFFLSPVFKIKEVKVLGMPKFLNLEEVKTKAEQVIPKNLLFVSKKNLKDSLLKEFLILDSVKVAKRLPNRIEILIEERKPIANYCFNEKCWYIDSKGIAFKEIGIVNDSYIKIVPEKIDDSSFPNVISKELLDKIILSKDEIKKIVGVNVLECKYSDLKLEIRVEQGWLAILDPKGNIKQQVNNLNLVFKNKIGQENVGSIDYIDVRLDKIFYMMK